MQRDQAVTQLLCAAMSHCAATASFQAAMRMSLLIVVLAWSNTSRADDANTASVTRAIRAVIDGPQSWMTSDKPDWYDRLAGVKLAGPTGELVESRGDLERQFATCTIGDTTWKLGSISLTIDVKRG